MIKYIRRRYLALKVDCPELPDPRMISDAIWNAVLRFFGEVGASQVGLYFIHFDEKTNYAVLRCSHKALPMVKAAIASVTKIADTPAAIHVLRVSGSLKSLSKKVAKTTSVKSLGETHKKLS